MTTITEDYVSFETARLLKEKGFHEKVNHVYHYYTSAPFYRRHLRDFNGEDYENLRHEHYSAPTLQMAIKWLREVHCICISMFYGLGNTKKDKRLIKWEWEVYDLIDDSLLGHTKSKEECCNTYEEATEEAIKFCLKYLI